MGIEALLREACVAGVQELYGAAVEGSTIQVGITSKEHEGDYTVVVFPLLRASKKSPETTANELGEYLKSKVSYVSGFNVIKGFLNLTIDDSFWLNFLKEEWQNDQFGKGEKKHVKIALEYCGPNTNKPLHLGHIRNMLLGYSLSNILAFDGNEEIKVNIYNDRGIAICKSMVAWQKFGNGENPDSAGLKGDHLAGKYYVEFDKAYKAEVKALVESGVKQEDAEKQAPLMQEAQEMLRQWEAGDTDVIRLWEQMNDWVYKGFFETYEKLGVNFDFNYYESRTYQLGRDMVREGLKQGVYFQKPDGSIWIDLTDKGLDQKVLLRSDGTSVYLTQDLGTAQLRYDDFKMDRSIYVVANEQDYHFKVLKLTLEKLGKPYAAGIYHLSYGLVELPHGRMKSREGTVVDADDLIDEMIASAEAQTKELGKIDDFTSEEANELYRTIGLGALKYFMLRVDPKKKMLFNPEESIELQGQTGPFIQYTYARIRSVLTKAGRGSEMPDNYPLNEAEKEVLMQLYQYPATIRESAAQMDPSIITMYVYTLAKGFNKFYQEHSILKAENEETKHFRMALAAFTATVIKSAMSLLGINVPERM
jgi:arginyl-tRNA synthetase